jgi:DNA-binding transcriptional regulator YiaG
MNQLTVLIGRLQAGGTEARDALFAAAYGELRQLARARLRDGGRNTLLDTTCLVHESYLHPRLTPVAQMRYSGGYSEQEIAETLAITERTVQRDWEKVRLICGVALSDEYLAAPDQSVA